MLKSSDVFWWLLCGQGTVLMLTNVIGCADSSNSSSVMYLYYIPGYLEVIDDRGHFVWNDQPKIKDDVGGHDEIIVFGYTMMILYNSDSKSFLLKLPSSPMMGYPLFEDGN